jgi:defect-in-organelle-trafficking protein DotC
MQRINWIMIVVLIGLLAACSSSYKEIDPTNLNQLQSLHDDASADIAAGTSRELSSIRVKALEDTAMSISAQGGLAWASEHINSRLTKDRWYLETVYNFNGMMLSHGVLPPVLVEGDNSLNLDDPSTIRVADKTYLIIQQARFVTTPPNWHDYLWMSFPKPEIPHRFLLPKNKQERAIWSKAIKTGWEKGLQQSSSIFQQNLSRLKRDYKGMILYRKLLEEKMISAPYVSRTELGVTGSGTDMRINDQVLRISVLPRLQTDSSGWKPIVVKQDGNYSSY